MLTGAAGCRVGFEPTTFGTTIRHSNQLNYWHHLICAAKLGIFFELTIAPVRFFVFFLFVWPVCRLGKFWLPLRYNTDNMTVQQASAEHAHLIGRAVVMAIGDEITRNLAGEKHTPADVEALFAGLAARTDTQYSYLNTLVALDENGEIMGLIVSYDGARLVEMRRIFFAEALRRLDLDFGPDSDSIDPETTPDEFYIDTLAVFEPYRGRGVGRELIAAAAARAAALSGKPLGLLVDKTNHRARRLYDSVGFVFRDERPFAGEVMDHMQLPF